MLPVCKNVAGWFVWLPALMVMLAAWVCAGTGVRASRPEYDQDVYHFPTIVKFAGELPRPDLTNYQSATTPGYHLILASAYRLIGDHPRVLRGIGAVFTAGLLALLAGSMRRSCGPRGAMVMTLPLAANLYVFSSCAWILPDNAGWLLVLGAMIYIVRDPHDAKAAMLGGAMILLLAMTRQTHLWICAPFLLSAALSESGRWRKLGFATISLAPAIIAMAGFYVMWNGLTPPDFQGKHQQVNHAVPAMILACAALPGAGFLSLLWDRRGLIGARWRWILGGLVAGLVLGIAPPTSYDYAAGRYSGWWNLARSFPVFLDRSPVIVGMSATGGAMLGAFLAGLPSGRKALLFGIAFAAFILGSIPGGLAYQRYFEPFWLMMFPLMASIGRETFGEGKLGRKLIGPAVLTALMGGITLVFLNRM